MGALYSYVFVEPFPIFIILLLRCLLVLYLLDLLVLGIEVRFYRSLPYFLHGRVEFVVFNVVRYRFVE